jgi:DNA-directed RNA polymerase specialized sigma24 family protein
MNKLRGTEGLKLSSRSARNEKVFAALPPLGSKEYIQHIQTAETETLPPEVLARALRQLPPGCEASRETFARLFRRRSDGGWDYLGAMVAYARRRSSPNDYEDRVQDALKRILEILPTARGEFAERAWHTFCVHELIEAWRERFGKRGERLPREIPMQDEDNEDGDSLPRGLQARFPHVRFKLSQVEIIEETALKVVSELPDEFARAVASRVWFQNERPKHSGRTESSVTVAPLTALFPGKSRFQIMRAERYADAQLAAALLEEPMLELDRDWRPALADLKANAPRPPRRAKEKNQ